MPPPAVGSDESRRGRLDLAGELRGVGGTETVRSMPQLPLLLVVQHVALEHPHHMAVQRCAVHGRLALAPWHVAVLCALRRRARRINGGVR